MVNALICPKCGQELNDITRYCPYCGFNLSIEESQNNRRDTNIYAIIGFVLTLTGGFLMVLAGLILCAIGINKANSEGYDLKGLALAGVIIAPIKLFLIIIFTILYLGLFFSL